MFSSILYTENWTCGKSVQGCRINQNEISFGGTGLSAVGLGVINKLRSMMSNALYNSTLSNDLLDSMQRSQGGTIPATNSTQGTTSSAHLSNSMPNSESFTSIEPVPRSQGANQIPTDSASGYSTQTSEATNSIQGTTSSAHLSNSMPNSESFTSIEAVPRNQGRTIPATNSIQGTTSQLCPHLEHYAQQ